MIAEIRTAYDAAKALVGAAQAAGRLEVVQRAVDLQQSILDLQERFGGLLDENRELRERIRALESAADIRAKAKRLNDAIWIGPADDPNNGPYCQNCYGATGRLIPLARAGNPAYGICSTCKASFRFAPHLDIHGQGEAITDYDPFSAM